ncbi:MAG TPA: CoA ester lyase [Gaiellaceae bacterium]|jgi:citrate lyase subunit beta/citryl-CoA lyase|nr:CoA ester lyase [Gaiellaceae bacterium]
MTQPAPLTWLYVPADRPDRVEKALASRAHAVIVDLEDAVAPAAKEAARAGLPALLGDPVDRLVHVRVNALATPFALDDLAAAAELAGVAGVTVAKVEDAADAERAVELAGGKRVQCLIESARGVEHAYAIASVPGVTGISLGEADLGGETGASGTGLDWARSRIVNAACAAGLPRPPQSVYPNVRDLDGLRLSCVRGRELGHLGRTAIHPDQLPVIESVYLPTEAEAERARALVAGFDGRSDSGVGAYALDDGSFVDAALVRSARQVAALADRYGTREG